MGLESESESIFGFFCVTPWLSDLNKSFHLFSLYIPHV